MKRDHLKEILDEYNIKMNLYDSFTKNLKVLLEKIIIQSEINIHSVTPRTKDLNSLKFKIIKSEGKYKNLEQITDLSGIRIITYLEDDVDSIAKLIEDEFEIDLENSVDKRKILDPDRFGYLSLHYIIKLKDDRIKLTEYREFINLKAEIQIRSILQHAWAEIEHDLGYINKEAVPKEIRRRFSRLAGLLEIADSEFISIRNEQEKYESEINTQIKAQNFNILIDQTSLEIFIKNDDLVAALDKEIAELTNAKIQYNKTFISRTLKKIKFCGYKTLDEIMYKLKINEKILLDFVKRWLGEKNIEFDNISKGTSLFYLCYITIAEENSQDLLTRYLLDTEIEDSHDNALETAKEILGTFHSSLSINA